MNKREFIKLFNKEDAYGFKWLPLYDGFSIRLRSISETFYLGYSKDFEDYDGYVTDRADDIMEITFKIALDIYNYNENTED